MFAVDTLTVDSQVDKIAQQDFALKMRGRGLMCEGGGGVCAEYYRHRACS